VCRLRWPSSSHPLLSRLRTLCFSQPPSPQLASLRFAFRHYNVLFSAASLPHFVRSLAAPSFALSAFSADSPFAWSFPPAATNAPKKYPTKSQINKRKKHTQTLQTKDAFSGALLIRGAGGYRSSVLPSRSVGLFSSPPSPRVRAAPPPRLFRSVSERMSAASASVPNHRFPFSVSSTLCCLCSVRRLAFFCSAPIVSPTVVLDSSPRHHLGCALVASRVVFPKGTRPTAQCGAKRPGWCRVTGRMSTRLMGWLGRDCVGQAQFRSRC